MKKEYKKIMQKACTILNNGGIILYPTDTIWGLGCDATNEEAIKKIYDIKNRKQNKPLIILIHDAKLLSNYVHSVPKIAYDIIEKSTQPTTIIYDKPIGLPELLIHQNTIAIRVIKNHNIKLLLKHFNKAITSTSANISTLNNPVSFSDIDGYIKNNVDYIVPENVIKSEKINKSSTIIKINRDSSITTIRH
tara:strand:+ start:1671 stop:2246 length:576 start_codon:yes stop_codon:yes gene_type:complete